MVPSASCPAGDPPGIRQSLLAKMAYAQAALAQGNVNAAINKLHALANEVEALGGTALTNDEADRIVALVSAVIDSVR